MVFKLYQRSILDVFVLSFQEKKRKEKRQGMYLREIQYDTGMIHIGYVNMRKMEYLCILDPINEYY